MRGTLTIYGRPVRRFNTEIIAGRGYTVRDSYTMSSYRRFLSSIVDTVIDASLLDNTSRLLDLLNGLNAEKLQKALNRTDERGFTPLHIAAERNQPESLKCLLIKEANPNIRSTLTTSEVTPLHIAALHGHLACLQLLVQLGGDIMVQDRYHLTPVDYAQINGQDLCFNYLNEIIAQRQAEERTGVEDVLIQVERNLVIDNIQTLNHWKQLSDLFPLSLNTQEPSQMESIMYRHCIIINNRDLVRILGRICKDIPISLHGASLLHAACRYGRTQLAKILVQKMPEITFSITNEAYNPLHVAVVHQHLDIVKILVQSQTSSGVKGHKASTETGSNEREHSFSGSLHLQQARFGEPTMSGHTVLHFTVTLNNTDILKVLVKHHRRLRLSYECSKCGYTPLHLAVFLNHTECARLLLKAGANPNACLTPTLEELTHISHSILSEAVINKNLGLLQTIIDYGGEDKGHSAIRLCIPSAEHRGFIVPLLGSLVRLDDGVRTNTQQNTRKVKTGIAEWGNLQLTEVDPSWIGRAIRSCKFLKVQKVDPVMSCDYLTTVNLSGNMLSWLPQELFQLNGLQILNVSSNRIAALPDLQQSYSSERDMYEWACGNVARLNLSRNQLTDLPDFLFKIPSLSHLDISYNQLQSLPFDLWSAPKLYHVTGSYNQLEALPTNWPGVLTSYRVYEPESQSGTESGKRGNMGRRDKGSRRKHMRSRTGTMTFEQDTEAPSSISQLHDCLDISNCNLPIEWSSGEGKEDVYDGLGILNLSNNRIREIPDNFPCLCPKLIRLDLSHNQLRSVSIPRQFPANLKHLCLSHNLIETLDCSTCLSKPLPCTNPLVLSETDAIYRDDVTYCCHRQHSQLRRLSVLELNSCQLREVNMHSMALAGGHRRRKGQQLVTEEGTHQPGTQSGCKVQNAEGLVCPLLTRLLLSHNQLTSVPDSVCKMIVLNSLDLSHNDIIELPAQLGNLCNLWEFPLDGLKLISPPHNIIERGKTRDIIGFLWSLLQRARPYHRMKLMLVGKAARGKTTLLSKISERGQRGLQENWALIRMVGADRRKGGNNLSTVGIVVSDWTYYKKVRESQTSLQSITFMTWDFGGQEEYYATHQCFISRRSLYLAVWDITHGIRGAEELRPWLLNIQARAPNSPVIIVATHMDKLTTRQMKEECRQCQEYIAHMYGTADRQREGFPHIMKSVFVSCKSGRGISELRDVVFDVASQVKENTVAGRGIGCGRIPDYRLLMDQLVPASYLQLEDTVRNLAMQMRGHNKPPVLTYKELRDLVFADSGTLISRHSADRELEQAVRFLHDNGTLLHYEDPLLADFYFVDPQWLCDMLAHIITVREINPFMREGVMRISDFSHIFNDDEFPMRWRREYMRLLTTFEVAVELGDGELLVPSALPCDKPNLPHNAFPRNVRMLPALRHTYIIPFVPSGFWPRLMSRVLSDKTIIQLARDGCNIEENDVGQLSWVKWRQGLILQYGNLNLMTVEELQDSLFPGHCQRRGVKVSHEGHWEAVRSHTKISGISVTVPDFFPILKYLEHAQKKRHRTQSTSSGVSLHSMSPGAGLQSMLEEGSTLEPPSLYGQPQVLPTVPEVSIEDSQGERAHDLSHDLGPSHDLSHEAAHDNGVTVDSCACRVVDIDTIDEEVRKLAMRCKDRCRLLSCDKAGVPRIATNPTSNWAGPVEDGTVPSPDGIAPRLNSLDVRRRSPSNDISPRLSIRTLSRGSRSSNPAVPQSGPPLVEEEDHDKMRAGLISKAVDHITLLIEDWFSGVKPRYHLVPCPHCTSNGDHGNHDSTGQVQLLRSFSTDTSLLACGNEREGLTTKHTLEQQPEKSILSGATRPHPSIVTSSPSARSIPAQKKTRSSPWRQLTQIGRKPRIGPVPQVPDPGQVGRVAGGGRYLEPECDQGTLQDPYNYAFRYDDCVVLARNQDYVTCPAHGKILLRYMAPDTLFVAQGKEILVSGDDCVEEGVLGQGAYATVFQVKIKKQQRGEVDYTGPFALKALTKEWSRKSASQATPKATPPRPPSRYSILTGFSNLKKELSILSPLKHDHVIRLHGVVLCPLGLILEHAPGGSLKKILEQYHDLQQYLHGNVIQAVILQVASAIQYLHSCSIIYRDLKSDNVLVWKFPVPQDSILIPPGRLGIETVLVKLSDLGISQFAATQGARGLVGTPGFMAPEILKYHGKEVYTDQVDVFSFGMFVYELLTLHIPYENLTAQQANQANESGTRPALTRKDLQCLVLLRELMVWCWQHHPDNRPTANDIITTALSDQFLRLLNGIRITRGQVTAACVAMTSPHITLAALHHHHSYRKIPSPPPPIHSDLTNPFISSAGDTKIQDAPVNHYGVKNESTGDQAKSSTDQVGDHADTGISPSVTIEQPPPKLPAVPSQRRQSASCSPTPRPLSAPTVYSPMEPHNDIQPSPGCHSNLSGTEARRSYSSDDNTTSTAELHPCSARSKVKASHLGLEEREGTFSPASGDSLFHSSEQEQLCEVWVAANNAHRAVLSVVGYDGHFTSLEELDVGDSPVLTLCTVHSTVWAGFQIGYILIFDSSSHHLVAQTWLHQYTSIISIVHIPELKRVYVTLATGSVFAFQDELCEMDSHKVCPRPICEYHDLGQPANCVTAVPLELGSGTSHELWVGQSEAMITVLNPSDLSVVAFIHNTTDLSPTPSYMAYLTYTNLVYSNYDTLQASAFTMETSTQEELTSQTVGVYGALYHGKYVTQWNAASKEMVTCHSCQECLEDGEECKISSLHCHSLQLLVGLCSGKILVLDAQMLSHLSTLTCHRGTVYSMVTFTQTEAESYPHSQFPIPQWNSGSKTKASGNSLPDRPSLGSMSGSQPNSADPSPIPITPSYSQYSETSILSTSQSTSSDGSERNRTGTRLLSFGSGFKSYYDGPESKPHLESGFMLVWDLHTDTGVS